MARPFRLEYAAAIYHVTARGDRREDIYLDEAERTSLEVLATVCHRFNWGVQLLLRRDEAFIAAYHQPEQPQVLRELPKAYRRALAKPLAEYQAKILDRDQNALGFTI